MKCLTDKFRHSFFYHEEMEANGDGRTATRVRRTSILGPTNRYTLASKEIDPPHTFEFECIFFSR
jgi:hypothetical protein